MTAHFDFSGATVLVTGSTKNLGLAIARAFARSRARVILHGPRAEMAVAARENLLGSEPGLNLETAGFDLAKPGEIDAAFSDLKRRGLTPDILVNNAAHLGVGAPGFLEDSLASFREVMEINLFGALHCSQLAAREMRQRGSGSIVHVSSLAGERAIWDRSAYNTSKAALDGLTRSMALELAPLGIRVNAVAPGYIWTPRWDDLGPGVDETRRKNIPAGEPSRQEEIASTVLFLCSSAAPSLIGERIVIDGGLNAQQLPRCVSG